jgi:hypothetical protein
MCRAKGQISRESPSLKTDSSLLHPSARDFLKRASARAREARVGNPGCARNDTADEAAQTSRSYLMSDREDDFAELLALFHAPMRLNRFGQRKDAIDHRPQTLFADELQNRVQFGAAAHIGTQQR